MNYRNLFLGIPLAFTTACGSERTIECVIDMTRNGSSLAVHDTRGSVQKAYLDEGPDGNLDVFIYFNPNYMKQTIQIVGDMDSLVGLPAEYSAALRAGKAARTLQGEYNELRGHCPDPRLLNPADTVDSRRNQTIS